MLESGIRLKAKVSTVIDFMKFQYRKLLFTVKNMLALDVKAVIHVESGEGSAVGVQKVRFCLTFLEFRLILCKKRSNA